MKLYDVVSGEACRFELLAEQAGDTLAEQANSLQLGKNRFGRYAPKLLGDGQVLVDTWEGTALLFGSPKDWQFFEQKVQLIEGQYCVQNHNAAQIEPYLRQADFELLPDLCFEWQRVLRLLDDSLFLLVETRFHFNHYPEIEDVLKAPLDNETLEELGPFVSLTQLPDLPTLTRWQEQQHFRAFRSQN